MGETGGAAADGTSDDGEISGLGQFDYARGNGGDGWLNCAWMGW